MGHQQYCMRRYGGPPTVSIWRATNGLDYRRGKGSRPILSCNAGAWFSSFVALALRDYLKEKGTQFIDDRVGGLSSI